MNTFIDAWKIAGPELERLRNERLMGLDDNAGLRSLGAYNSVPLEQHGMAIMQSWFMQMRVKQLKVELEDLRRARQGPHE